MFGSATVPCQKGAIVPFKLAALLLILVSALGIGVAVVQTHSEPAVQLEDFRVAAYNHGDGVIEFGIQHLSDPVSGTWGEIQFPRGRFLRPGLPERQWLFSTPVLFEIDQVFPPDVWAQGRDDIAEPCRPRLGEICLYGTSQQTVAWFGADEGTYDLRAWSTSPCQITVTSQLGEWDDESISFTPSDEADGTGWLKANLIARIKAANLDGPPPYLPEDYDLLTSMRVNASGCDEWVLMLFRQ